MAYYLFQCLSACDRSSPRVILKFAWLPHRRQKTNVKFSPQNAEAISNFPQHSLFSYYKTIESFEPAGNGQTDCYSRTLTAPKNCPEQCYIRT